MTFREPTGEELLEALIAIREGGKPKWATEIVFFKLYGMWRRRFGFLGRVEEDLVVETCLVAIDAEFRGQSAGEAVVWINTVARNKSIDQKRREKRDREGSARLALATPQGQSLPEPSSRAIGYEDAERFIVMLRDELLPSFCREKYPRRQAARSQAELAYLAAMDREVYERALAEAEDDKERQRLHKQMGRGRDDLWIPFLEALVEDPSLEEWQSEIVEHLLQALAETRRGDHGRPRGAGGGSR